MLTVIRLGLPTSCGARSAAPTRSRADGRAAAGLPERRRRRDARVALRRTATAMLEAEKSFRRLKADKQLPIL